MEGDKGAAKLLATNSGGWLDLSPTPLTAEFARLAVINPDELIVKAASYLQTLGVTKASALSKDAYFLLLGNPHHVQRKGKDFIVADVLNGSMAWGKSTSKRGTIKSFGDTGVSDGLFLGDQKYVFSCDAPVGTFTGGDSAPMTTGEFFFNCVAALVQGDEGIIYNAHVPDFSLAVFHEVLHTFEGSTLASQRRFAEGIVEALAIVFALAVYGQAVPEFEGYKEFLPDARKIVAFAGWSRVAKAFFTNCPVSLKAVLPLFCDETQDDLPATDRLSVAARSDGKLISAVSPQLTPTAMGKSDSWHNKWDAAGHDPTAYFAGLEAPKGPVRTGPSTTGGHTTPSSVATGVNSPTLIKTTYIEVKPPNL
jgi:hypothetical protein